MTRVLVLSNLYPPYALGGYEGACRDAVERFRQGGHDVEVLTSSYGVSAPRPANEDHVHRTLRLTSTFVPSPPVAKIPFVERANVRTLRHHLRTFRPDLVSVWNMSGLSLSLLPTLASTGVPVLFVVCDEWLVGSVARDAWMAPFATRRRLGAIASRVTGLPTELGDLGHGGDFVFASAWLRDRCTAATGWSFGTTHVVHLGVDLDDFPVVDRDPAPFTGRLLFVGRLDPAKGVATLVRALQHLPPSMRLDVIGPGDEGQRRDLDALVLRLGLTDRVHFATEQRELLAAWYLASDVVVFPSEWDEPFGIVPLEAMACGVPVVATGTGGSAEYLRPGENCLLFPRGDAAALAAAVERLAAEPHLRRRLVEGGRATASTITTDAMAAALEVVHEAAVHPRP